MACEADQLKEVWPLDRISFGQHKYGTLSGRDLIDQPLAFASTQFFGWAEARQWIDARSHAGVTSQTAMKGRSSKLVVLIC